MKRNPVRLWFWLKIMDVTSAVGRANRRLYLWAVSHASANEDWGDPSEWSTEAGEGPF